MPTKTKARSGDFTRVSIEMPGALRTVIDQRATHLGVSTVAVVTASLRWFIKHAAHGELPVLIVDPDHLPEVPTTYPRSLTLALPNEVLDGLDELINVGTYRTDRSNVTRAALGYYLSACGALWHTRFTEPRHLMNV